MTCSTCNKPAPDNACAYYNVGTLADPLFKCWLCLSTVEKLDRDGGMKDPRRFKIQKTIKEDS